MLHIPDQQTKIGSVPLFKHFDTRCPIVDARIDGCVGLIEFIFRHAVRVRDVGVAPPSSQFVGTALKIRKAEPDPIAVALVQRQDQIHRCQRGMRRLSGSMV